MSKPISKPGTYGAGDYRLAGDLAVGQGAGVKFTGDATLDLNGHRIEGAASGTIGVDASRRLILHDAKGGGGIAGFRIGVSAAGARSRILGIALSARYIGVSLVGDDSEVIGCTIADIEGVSDEPYAVGVQIGAVSGCTVARCVIRNVYRQAEYAGTAPGEGVAVNVSSDAQRCAVRACMCTNDEARPDTIGVFVGSGAGHVIEDNMLRNFMLGVAAASDTAATIDRNLVALETPVARSLAISGKASTARANVVAGPFDVAVAAAETAGNLVTGTAPRIPPPELPPKHPTAANEGTILTEALDGFLGNIGGKTARIEIKAAALTPPPGKPTRLRLMLRATPDEPFAVGAIHVGPKAPGGAAGEAAALHRLTLGGAGAFVIPTGAEAWTDWCGFEWDGRTDLIVSLYCDGRPWEDKMAARMDTEHTTHLKDGDEAGAPRAAGFVGYPGYLAAVAIIETDGF